jgi:glycerate kinase
LRTAGFDEVVELPLADGGEGTLDAMIAALGGSRRQARVSGPLGDPVDAEWALLPGGLAIVECAAASGIALVEGRNDPLRASTRGTGELVAAAIRAGARRVLLGVGGTATTDGGLAALEALGWSLGGTPLTVAYDVSARFLEASQFSAQKGASPAQVQFLARRLAQLAETYLRRTGVDVRELEGSGAAGGLPGGLAAIGASLEPGFDVVAEAVGLEGRLDGVDLVVTGEGRLDATTFLGKVVGGVLEWAADLDVPRVAVIAGQVTDEAREEAMLRPGVSVLALTERVWQAGEAFARAELLVEEAALEVGRAVLADH